MKKSVGNPNMQIGMPSVNKRGRPPGVFSTFADKAGHFLETLPRSEIIAISKDDERLDTYTAFEAMVLMQLGNALQRCDADKIDLQLERERLYDRTAGKPQASLTVDHTGAVTVFTADLSPLTQFLADYAVSGKSDALPADVPERSLLPAPVRA